MFALTMDQMIICNEKGTELSANCAVSLSLMSVLKSVLLVLKTSVLFWFSLVSLITVIFECTRQLFH